MKRKPPTIADIEAAGQARADRAALLQGDIAALTDLVVEGLRAGLSPTKVATAAQWTGAHVRKIARDHGIPPDERYAGRSARLRKAQSPDSDHD